MGWSHTPGATWPGRRMMLFTVLRVHPRRTIASPLRFNVPAGRIHAAARAAQTCAINSTAIASAGLRAGSLTWHGKPIDLAVTAAYAFRAIVAAVESFEDADSPDGAPRFTGELAVLLASRYLQGSPLPAVGPVMRPTWHEVAYTLALALTAHLRGLHSLAPPLAPLPDDDGGSEYQATAATLRERFTDDELRGIAPIAQVSRWLRDASKERGRPLDAARVELMAGLHAEEALALAAARETAARPGDAARVSAAGSGTRSASRPAASLSR